MTSIQAQVGGEVVASTVPLPRRLRDEMKIQAIRAGRSFNTHIVMVLATAAGGEFGDQAPAAGNENAARQGSAV